MSIKSILKKNHTWIKVATSVLIYKINHLTAIWAVNLFRNKIPNKNILTGNSGSLTLINYLPCETSLKQKQHPKLERKEEYWNRNNVA